MPALRFKRPIQPILQIEPVRLAVVFWDVEISNVNLKALTAVFLLQVALKS